MRVYAEKLYLSRAGFTLVLVGSVIALTPTRYFQSFYPDLMPSISYLSELRGMGGGLLVFGLLACCALGDRRVADTAINATALIFAAFAAFRMIGIASDGLPQTAILAAMLIELTLASAGLWLIRLRNAPGARDSQTQTRLVAPAKES